jgi:hypothetical protein
MKRVLLVLLLAACVQKGDPNKAPTEASVPAPKVEADDLEPDEDVGDIDLDNLDKELDAIEKEVNQYGL